MSDRIVSDRMMSFIKQKHHFWRSYSQQILTAGRPIEIERSPRDTPPEVLNTSLAPGLR